MTSNEPDTVILPPPQAPKITKEIARELLSKGLKISTNAFSHDSGGQMRDLLLVNNQELLDLGLPLDFQRRGESVVSTSYGALIHSGNNAALPLKELERVAEMS